MYVTDGVKLHVKGLYSRIVVSVIFVISHCHVISAVSFVSSRPVVCCFGDNRHNSSDVTALQCDLYLHVREAYRSHETISVSLQTVKLISDCTDNLLLRSLHASVSFVDI